MTRRNSLKQHRDVIYKSFAVGLWVSLLIYAGFIWPRLAKAQLLDPISTSPAVNSGITSGNLHGQVSAGEKLNCEEAIEIFFGVNAEPAKAVSGCESEMRAYAKSPVSSAKGCFQIIDGTWKLFKCDGDPLKAVDNARCAKKIYDHTKSWNTSGGWQASAWCHKQV